MEDNEVGIGIAAISTAVAVILGTFFDLFQSGIQIIGVGTAISLVIGSYKLIIDRRESKRRKKLEGIQRLQPNIYSPLLTWAVAAKKSLKEYGSDDIYNYLGPGPTSLDGEADYIAIVGETLKKSIKKINDAFLKHYETNEKVKKEYNERVSSLITKLGKRWGYKSTQIITEERGTLDVAWVLNQHGMKTIREYLKSSKPIMLRNSNLPMQDRTID